MVINGFTPSTEIFNKDTLGVEKNKNVENKESKNMFKDTLDRVNQAQIENEKAQEAFIKGEDIDIHEVMLKGQEAKLSLQFAVEVRNKLVEAYQEINRMQL